MDFTLRVSKDYQNIVTSLIKIEHYSTGKLSKNWLSTILYIWQYKKKIKLR